MHARAVSTSNDRKVTHMRISPKIAAVAAGVLALAGAGAGTAVAASQSAAVHTAVTSAEPTSPDTDNIQLGDQTTPDNSGAAATTMVSQHQKASGGGENTENSGEGGKSDGPGGHADPSGNVQHEFSGVE
jgi:hypothetical protein